MSKQYGEENDTVKTVDKETKSEFAVREEAVQKFWEAEDIFNKSLATPGGQEPKGDFVFYDGPPFATGLPHYGHILAGTIKDAIPRFWTMNGYRVRRKWGWDCHGLPLENLIEKKLGLATKRDIEEYGVKNFNEAARTAVMEYADDWRRIIPRMGRFADMEHGYKTMDSTYTESVWWVFKTLSEKGLVYEGFKSMHLCPRCGTTLSNFEVNQGYKDVKDISVFVEFPLVDEPNTAFLAWTTTPWTLPGNMALAVNGEFKYYAVTFQEGEEALSLLNLEKDKIYIASREFWNRQKLGLEENQEEGGYTREIDLKLVRFDTRSIKGTDLLGKKYEPPFNYLKEQLTEDAPKAWTVFPADFVELGEEGTGIVHIAPAYGEDDMKLGQEHGLPIMHHVDESGRFKDFITDFAGQLVKPKDDDDAGINHMDADIEIIRALAAKGRLFAKEKVTHSYPHCWRCETPLLNYATTSWFVEVTKMKDRLVAANEQVNWIPDHVGTSRFGKWLAGARDWAVSRQRYWGAPIPIWRNPQTKEYKVLGSLAELQEYLPKSGNTYLLMRHGQSESNVADVISCNKGSHDGLTDLGKEQVKAAAAALPKDVDIIIHSGFERTKQTAEIIAAAFPEALLLEDDRIRELDLADEFEGKKWPTYNDQFTDWPDRFTKVLSGSENRREVQRRMGAFLDHLEDTYQGKKILLVSHAGPLFALECAAWGLDVLQSGEYFDGRKAYLTNAEVRLMDYVPYPRNDNYELDFHRPYIDEIDMYDGEVKLERVPDVFDCWFESGSMPYGQHHYPFENNETFTKEHFPARFIAEGLDQTRGWFYSLLVLGVALFDKSPYENVIVNGLVLAEDGKKMSKSLQNYPDPMELANRTGVDAMRFYLLSSPVIKGEDLNFSEKEVLELQRKNLGRLHNVLAMYEMYEDGAPARDNSTHVLDSWIVARLNQLITETTTGYRNYELDKATRPITDFIDDLSVWYLRRSRDRVKGDDSTDKKDALATLRYTLRTLALVMAPVMPFYADYLWRAVKEEGDTESVHLAAWPQGGVVDEAALESMIQARAVVSLVLEARTAAKLNVRQPIAAISGPALGTELQAVVLDEVNAKQYKVVAEAGDGLSVVSIEPELTPELLAEGAIRELMRAVQGQRKTSGLAPEDEIVLTIDTDEAGKKAVNDHKDLIVKTVGAPAIDFSQPETGTALTAGVYKFNFAINKM